MSEVSDARKTGYSIQSCWLPCCDAKVQLRIPAEREGIHLHERKCKNCGRVWTFATERKREDIDTWSTGTSIKLGKPTVPAVEEVLMNREEDGWLDAHNRDQMRTLGLQIKAGQI